MIANNTILSFFNYTKTVIQHKIAIFINRLIDLQGFFNKIVACFIFINIFAFC